MNSGTESSTVLTAAALIAGSFVLLFLVCRPTDPNAELARTAREAVQLARDTASNDASAVLWTGRFRLLAIVIGVSVPLVVVLLIWRTSAHSELDPTEIVEAAELLALPDPGDAPHENPAAERRDALPAEVTDKPAADRQS